MASFLFKVLLFILPVGAIFAVPMAVFFLAREHVSMESAVLRQLHSREILYGKAFIDSDNTGRLYKRALAAQRDSRIVALGSSRTLEFREEFFADQAAFINVSFGGADIGLLEESLKRIPVERVEVVLLGLDQSLFKPGYEPAPIRESQTVRARFHDFLTQHWRKIYLDLAQQRFSVSALLKLSFSAKNIGLSALVHGNGFRSDGSYRYGKELTSQSRRADLATIVETTLKNIRADRSSFDYGAEVSPDSLISLDRLLQYAKKENIIVVGFIPPYVPEIYDEITGVNDAYAVTVEELPREISRRFEDQDYQLFDFSDARVLGDVRHEFVNDTHATDKLNLRMLLYMAARSPELRPYVSIDAAARLSASDGDFLPL